MSVTYTAALPVREETVLFLSGLLHAERRRIGTRAGTRSLGCFKQAILVLRWLRSPDPPEKAAAGHPVPSGPAWRPPHHPSSSRTVFDADAVKREMRVIAEDLHCDAVRITGGDPERLVVAAGHAADAGLEVWFSPFPCEQTAEQLLPYFADCADRAEAVGAAVFVAGCELSLFAAGFLPGADTFARIKSLTSGDATALSRLTEAYAPTNALLSETAATVRQRFRGKVTYASGTWEDIDWAPFDIVGVDAYVDPTDPGFRPALRELFRHGKPIVATEFGCCTYRGAAARGGMGWDIVDHDADPPRINGDYIRDEDEQARYFRRLIDVFDAEGVDTAFWFTFAGYTNLHHADPRLDLDLASYGVCKLMPDGSLTPKQSFHAMAEAYQ